MGNETLTREERDLALKCMDRALAKGAEKVRVTAYKSVSDSVGTLNGEIDKVKHVMDRFLSVGLIVDGRFGSFSTNRLEEAGLDAFLDRAISLTRMLAPDPCRDLPDPARTAKDAVTGTELNLYDDYYERMTPELRLRLALDASLFGKRNGERWTLVSEEAEYLDNVFDTFLVDSQGLRCRHIETSFEYGVEMTILDKKGAKYSKYWSEGAPMLKDLDINSCCPKALDLAVEMLDPKRHRTCKTRMVIDTECASRVVSPLLRALNAYSIQQNNSFLMDTAGKQVFPEGLTILDCARTPGETGSRLFDSEGVATRTLPIIDKGTVCQYFVNTYMAGKTGLAPTIEDAIHPKVLPWPRKGLGRKEILEMCGEGILVTGFNGGNSNSATGNFSYGIEGFAFKDGRITHPIRDMVVTGSFLDLWSRLIACGDDARANLVRTVPTLAFDQVDFSA